MIVAHFRKHEQRDAAHDVARCCNEAVLQRSTPAQKPRASKHPKDTPKRAACSVAVGTPTQVPSSCAHRARPQSHDDDLRAISSRQDRMARLNPHRPLASAARPTLIWCCHRRSLRRRVRAADASAADASGRCGFEARHRQANEGSNSKLRRKRCAERCTDFDFELFISSYFELVRELAGW